VVFYQADLQTIHDSTLAINNGKLVGVAYIDYRQARGPKTVYILPLYEREGGDSE